MKREIQAIAVMLALLAAAWVGYGWLFGTPGGGTLRVAALEGQVTVADAAGGTAPAEVGGLLDPSARVRTGPDGRAVLALGEEGSLVLESLSSLRVVEVAADGVRLELEDGRVRATVRPSGPSVGIAAGDTLAAARDAEFAVARGEDGTVGVATERGAVTVSGGGASVEVAAGQKVVVPRGRQVLVQPAAESLLLAVDRPPSPRTRETTVALEGTTEPGAEVAIAGGGAPVRARADADGRFAARVELAEGENALTVTARSVLGQEARVDWRVTRDTEPPPISVEIRP